MRRQDKSRQVSPHLFYPTPLRYLLCSPLLYAPFFSSLKLHCRWRTKKDWLVRTHVRTSVRPFPDHTGYALIDHWQHTAHIRSAAQCSSLHCIRLPTTLHNTPILHYATLLHHTTLHSYATLRRYTPQHRATPHFTWIESDWIESHRIASHKNKTEEWIAVQEPNVNNTHGLCSAQRSGVE